MANIIEPVIPQLLAQGLMKLRANAVMPSLVNRGYEETPGRKGSTVDVPMPVSVKVRDVAPSNTPPQAPDTEFSTKPIPVNQWKEAPFYMTDKDLTEVMDGALPAQAEAAIVSLADHIDDWIFQKMINSSYLTQGTAGTTPMGGGKTTDITQAGKLLNENKAPATNRYIVMDPSFQASALEVRAFQDISWAGSAFVIQEGQVPRRLGFDFFMDQNVRNHTTGGGSSWAVNKSGGGAKGDKTLPIDGGTGNPKVGDVFTLAGNTQTYVVTNFDSGNNIVTFLPGLVSATADNTAITFVGNHTANFAFHRDAFAFVSRPLSDEVQGFGSSIESQTDPVSGLTLRLEVSRQHKQLEWSFDVLFGGEVLRPENIVRILG